MVSYGAAAPHPPNIDPRAFSYECRPSSPRDSSLTPLAAAADLHQARTNLSSTLNGSLSATFDALLPAQSTAFESDSIPMTESGHAWPGLYVTSDYGYETSSNYQTAASQPYTIGYEEQGAYSCQGSGGYDPSNSFFRFPSDDLQPNSESTCPRDYPSDLDMASLSTLTSPTEAFPPSSYLMDPQKHQAYMTYGAQAAVEESSKTEQDGGKAARPEVAAGRPEILSQCRTPAASLSPTQSYQTSVVQSVPSVDSRFDNAADEEGGDSIVEEESDAEDNEPYAKLIHRALMSAPGHRMVLREIYDWFATHTDKNKNPAQRGWQNSIRHNLSMNGAFKKVEQDPPSEDSKKGFVWVLQPQAIREGVKSTTRYRKTGPGKRVARSEAPAPQRQLSGRKGGQAAKRGKTAKAKREKVAAAAAACVSASTQLRVDAGRRYAAQREQAGSPRSAQHHQPPTPETLSNEPMNHPYYYEQPAMESIPPQQQQQQQHDPADYARLGNEVVGVADALTGQALFCDDPDHDGLHLASEYVLKGYGSNVTFDPCNN